jgi:hypothetical protein
MPISIQGVTVNPTTGASSLSKTRIPTLFSIRLIEPLCSGGIHPADWKANVNIRVPERDEELPGFLGEFRIEPAYRSRRHAFGDLLPPIPV